MFRIDEISITPPVLLAPMAGITDRVFRDLVREFGAGLVTSEMVASQEMVQAKASVKRKADMDAGLSAVQIAGREAHWMAEATRVLVDQGVRIIDINMGCPAKKVTNGASGSALMRDPDHALGLIDAVVAAAGPAPVTLKMRLGWDEDYLTGVEIARRGEAAGLRAITVHGRTRCQFYKGAADWTAIRPIVEAVSIPVIANGDIVCAQTGRSALAASGAAAVMVGRAARGAPWRVAQIAAGLAGQPVRPRPAGADLAALICRHYEAQLLLYGRDVGMRTARKHLGWYLEHVPGAQALRDRLVRLDDPTAVLTALRAELPELDGERIAA